MTPRRREILHRYLATGNAKGCGVSATRVRLIVRDALAEYGCPNERLLVLYLDPPRRRRRATTPAGVPIWHLDPS